MIVKACVDAGGSITGEHGVSVDKKKRYMTEQFSDADLGAFQRLRCAFDPDQQANPGKVMPTPRLCGEVPGEYRHPLEQAGLAGGASDGGRRGARHDRGRGRRAAALERIGPPRADRGRSDEAGLGRRGRRAGGVGHRPRPGDRAQRRRPDRGARGRRCPWPGPRRSSPRRVRCSHSTRPARTPIGGIVASGDSGPLRARYGSARDLVVGMRVALADGTVARSGGKVIKNVAGRPRQDLHGLVRHARGHLGGVGPPAPSAPATATALGHSADRALLARGAAALSHARLEQLGLDVRWARGAAPCSRAGATPVEQAEAAERLLREQGLDTELREDDEGLWEAQREGQRSPVGLSVRVSAADRPAQPAAHRPPRRHAGGPLRPGPPLAAPRRRPPPASWSPSCARRWTCSVLDRPHAGLDLARDAGLEPGAEALMRRVKERFDPKGTLV